MPATPGFDSSSSEKAVIYAVRTLQSHGASGSKGRQVAWFWRGLCRRQGSGDEVQLLDLGETEDFTRIIHKKDSHTDRDESHDHNAMVRNLQKNTTNSIGLRCTIKIQKLAKKSSLPIEGSSAFLFLA